MIWGDDGLDSMHLNWSFSVRLIPALLPALSDESSHLRKDVMVREAERGPLHTSKISQLFPLDSNVPRYPTKRDGFLPSDDAANI